MPINYKHYAPNWHTEIRPAIMARATGSDGVARCEQCGVPDRVEILRHSTERHRYLIYDLDKCHYRTPDGRPLRLEDIPEGFDCYADHTFVILTIHHIGIDKPDGTPGSPHDKLDNRPENLTALCQRCHLLADMPHHNQKRRRTMLNRKHIMARNSGQLPLWGIDHDR